MVRIWHGFLSFCFVGVLVCSSSISAHVATTQMTTTVPRVMDGIAFASRTLEYLPFRMLYLPFSCRYTSVSISC